MNAIVPTAKHALLSPCKKYRYSLTRRWDMGSPPVTFVMLNPSTADAEIDDATIMKISKFAKRWGYGGVFVANLFAYRATKPEAMFLELRKGVDIKGPDNDSHIAALVGGKDVILGWGTHDRAHARAKEVLHLVRERARSVKALGVCIDGQPKHPLYIKDDTIPANY